MVCVHTHAHKHAHVLWCVFGDPRMSYGTWFSPSTMSVPDSNLAFILPASHQIFTRLLGIETQVFTRAKQ